MAYIHFLVVVKEDGACRKRGRIRAGRKRDACETEPAARVEQTFGIACVHDHSSVPASRVSCVLYHRCVQAQRGPENADRPHNARAGG